MTPEDLVPILLATQPDKTRHVHRENGMIDWTFSELCFRYGYEDARWWAEFFITHEELLGATNRPILKSYRRFLEAKSIIH